MDQTRREIEMVRKRPQNILIPRDQVILVEVHHEEVITWAICPIGLEYFLESCLLFSTHLNM